MLASTARDDGRVPADFSLGAFGTDLNADHLAVAETHRFDNCINTFSVQCITHGKTTGQRRQAGRVAAKAVVTHAKRVGKPLVHKHLDFSRRKRELAALRDPPYARMLSSFDYGAPLQALQRNGLLADVVLAEVNPVDTSVSG
jgi:hypothetical protein